MAETESFGTRMQQFVRYLLLEIGCFVLTSFYSIIACIMLALRFVKNGKTAFTARKPVEKPKCLEGWKEGFLHVADIKLHYVEAGDPEQPLMLFVHGFPEFWYSWRFQLKHFQNRYHVVAIDMRGYGDSDKPNDLDSYDIKFLIKDVVETILALGHTKAILVGHDWGALVAWYTAIVQPEVVHKLVILNVPHPDSLLHQISSRWSQFISSWYMFFFQAPHLPELQLESNDLDPLIKFFRSDPVGLVHKENFTDEDEQAWRYCFRASGSLTSPINYYRAAKRRVCIAPLGIDTLVQPETLIIWGERDAALVVEGALDSLTRCEKAHLKRIPDASHWVQQDVPEIVNQHIEEFLKGYD